MKQPTTAELLLRKAASLGIRLEQEGLMLAISPADECPEELLDKLRAHKQEVLDLLESRAAGLHPSCAPWLHISRQIVEGEFDGADGSTRQSLRIGVRNIAHPACRRALERLDALEAKA
jgi:hypothetical protein